MCQPRGAEIVDYLYFAQRPTLAAINHRYALSVHIRKCRIIKIR